jgi:hypothetical protein
MHNTSERNEAFILLAGKRDCALEARARQGCVPLERKLQKRVIHFARWYYTNIYACWH